MKKSILFLALISTFVLFSCNKIDKDLGTPACVNDKISEHDAVKVWKWENGSDVLFLVALPCCDLLDLLYDAECNLVCAPSGGISGDGDDTCSADIMNTEFEKTLIFER